MDKQVLAVWAQTMENIQKSENQEAQKGRFWAFLDVPAICPQSAHESFSFGSKEKDHFLPAESIVKSADNEASKQLNQRKEYANLIKKHLSSQQSKEKLVAFMRYHDGVSNADITACIMAVIRLYAPGKPINAKDTGASVANYVNVSQRFVRDDIIGLLVSIGLLQRSGDTEGVRWTDLAANRHKTRDAAIELLKRAAKPAYPELYDEQRKLAAAIKANELAKRRQEVARSTAAIIANTDQLPHIQRDSNTKVVLTAVAAALFAGGVLLAKYGDSQPAPSKKQEITQEQSAPMFDIEKMLSESNSSFYKLPMEEQARLIDQAKQAFAE